MVDPEAGEFERDELYCVSDISEVEQYVRGVHVRVDFKGMPLTAPMGETFRRIAVEELERAGVEDARLAVPKPRDVETRSEGLFAAQGVRSVPCAGPASVEALAGTRVLAFAGIGDPERFFATVAKAGIDAPIRRGFPDHHRYRASDAKALIEEAAANKLSLLTTEKDAARIEGEAAVTELAARARVRRELPGKPFVASASVARRHRDRNRSRLRLQQFVLRHADAVERRLRHQGDASGQCARRSAGTGNAL